MKIQIKQQENLSDSTDIDEDSFSNESYDTVESQQNDNLCSDSKAKESLFFENCLIDNFFKKYLKIKQCFSSEFDNKCAFQTELPSNLRSCSDGRFYCQSCSGDAHLPLTCKQKQEWDNIDKNKEKYSKFFQKSAQFEENLFVQKVEFQCFQDTQVKQTQEDYQQIILVIEDKIGLFFDNEDQLNDQLKQFKEFLNLLIVGQIFYLNSIPLCLNGFFIKEEQKLLHFVQLQEKLKQELHSLKRQLTAGTEISLNYNKIIQTINGEEIVVKDAYYLYLYETLKLTNKVKNAIRDFQTQVCLVFPEEKILNK